MIMVSKRIKVWSEVTFFGLWAAMCLVTNAVASPDGPGTRWPWGQPIELITVHGFGRTVTLSDPNSLRYVAMAIERKSSFFFHNGPPSAPFRHGEYFAAVSFANGRKLYRECFARRYPRALCFSRYDPRTVRAAPGSQAPLVRLYRPMPRDLARFWRFLATPGDQGTRCFGPPAAPLPFPVAKAPLRPQLRPFHIQSALAGFSPLHRIVFTGHGLHIDMKDKAALGFLDASQGVSFPSANAAAAEPVYGSLLYGSNGQVPRRRWVFPQKYPRALVFSEPASGAGNVSTAGPICCSLYGPLPPSLYSAYEAMECRAPARTNAVHAVAARPVVSTDHLLAGTALPILRIVFADRTGPVVTLKDRGQIDLRQQSSIDYILRSQRYFNWGFLGDDKSPRYAVMFFIRGRKTPVLAWAAVEKYPREFVFSPDNVALSNRFTAQPQIRCPLYGPLPSAIYAAYETLLHVATRAKSGRIPTVTHGNRGTQPRRN